MNPMVAGQFLQQQQQQQQQQRLRAAHAHQQVSATIIQHISQHAGPFNGWHASMLPAERHNKAMQLFSNIQLANPGIALGQAVRDALTTEKECFLRATDKQNYEQLVTSRLGELFKRRQANESALRGDLNAQAAHVQAQQQAQAQQQQQMAALQAMRGIVPQNSQQGLSHLQQQMQASPIPQQQVQPGMNMPNQNSQHMSNQPPFQMGLAQAPNQGQPPQGQNSNALNPMEQKHVMDLANALMARTNDTQKQQLRQQLMSRMTPQQIQHLTSSGRDPLLMMFQQQALQNYRNSRQQFRPGQQHGMPPNPATRTQNPLQIGMPPGTAPPGMDIPFSNGMDTSQMMGLPARNATPQPPMPGMAPNQPQNQTQRPQITDQANMQQPNGPGGSMAHSQPPNMTTQPGGMPGSTATSASPGMGMRRPQVPIQGQMPQSQPNTGPVRQYPPGIINTFIQSLPPDKQQLLSRVPQEKVTQLVTEWLNQRRRNTPQDPGIQVPVIPGPTGPAPMHRPTQPVGPNSLGQTVVEPPSAPNMGQNPMAAQFTPMQRTIMDSMDVSLPVIQRLGNYGVMVPPQVKKWRELKQLLSTANVPPNVRNTLEMFQKNQFVEILKRQQQQNRPQNMPVPATTMPQAPGMNNMGALNIPPGRMPNFQISHEEFLKARNHPQLKQFPDDKIREILIQMKQKQWLGQQVIRQGPPNLKQPQFPNPTGQPQLPQPTQVVQPQPQLVPQPQQETAPPTSAPQLSQPAVSKQVAANMEPAAPKQVRPAAGPRQDAQKPSPALATKKRQAEDAADAPNPGQTPRPASQPQPPMPSAPLPQFTAERIAAMDPETRRKYEQYVAAHEFKNKMKSIIQEESQAGMAETMPDISMTAEQKKEIGARIKQVAAEYQNVMKTLPAWYQVTKDDARVRMFFRTRSRLTRQFVNNQPENALKETFSLRPQDLDQIQMMLNGMRQDLAQAHGNRMSAQSSQPAPQPQQRASQPQTKPNQQASPSSQITRPQAAPAQNAPSAPLTAENLEKQQRTHQRTASRAVASSAAPAAPTAPTTSQPPFPMGALSPHGQPTYVTTPTLTQDGLKLPPQKKRKTGTAQASQPISSPDLKKQAPPESKKAPISCPYTDCETVSGFADEASRDRHIEEEHKKPNQDPMGFLQDALTLSLGLDSVDVADAGRQPVTEVQPLVAPQLTSSASKQGQTPIKLEAGTPMSRDSSMKRQGSNLGGKTADLNKAISKNGTAPTGPTGDTSKIGSATPATVLEAAQTLTVDDPWANSTIDPQTLLSTIGPLDGTIGLMSDLTAYRALTPNDTPESSKDSGSSEPNSDISENANLDIDLTMQEFDPQLLSGLDTVNLDAMDGLDDGTVIFGDSVFSSLPPLEGFDNPDFSKPFDMDVSMYSMDLN